MISVDFGSQRQRLRAAFAILVLLCLLPAQAWAAFSFAIPAERIQNALLLFFPLREYAIDARLMLAEPRVILKGGAGDLQLDIPVVASVSGQGRVRGEVTVDVGLHYKPSTGELFLGIPRLRRFEMAGIDEARRKAFRGSINDVLVKTLPLVRIHRVRERDLNHSLAKSRIKAMAIEDGVLRMTIGFD